ncbi:MAG: prepilin-type N-terminal cleavage/methylation domain-containing protein [Bacilli bacterium]|nr:prepilin-type N-terminal cleavage/methylation domain-containing protein [Bacilli bacterium]
MKKGFTLIELLAVIVILAVISLVTAPMLLKVIENAKIKSIENSVYGLRETADLYFSENSVDIVEEFICDSTGCNSENNKLKFKGQIDSGRVKIYNEGEISICLETGKYAAIKLADEENVTVSIGNCDYTSDQYKVDEIAFLGSYSEFKEKYEAEISQMKEKYETEISDLKIQLSQTTSDYEGQLTTQQEAYETQLAQLNNQKNQLIQDYEGQLVTQQEAYDTQISALNAQIISVQSSLNTVTTQLNTLKSIGSASASDILIGKTAVVKGSTVTGSMVNNATQTTTDLGYDLTNSTLNVYFPAGAWLTQYSSHSNNAQVKIPFSSLQSSLGISASKIAVGQSITGINGTYTSDATATSGDIANGKTAYVNGTKVTGTLAVSSFQKVSLGTGNTGGVRTFNVSSYPGYQNFTVNNFFLVALDYSTYSPQTYVEYNTSAGSSPITPTYNATTGIYTVPVRWAYNWIDQREGYNTQRSWSVNYQVYLVY